MWLAHHILDSADAGTQKWMLGLPVVFKLALRFRCRFSDAPLAARWANNAPLAQSYCCIINCFHLVSPYTEHNSKRQIRCQANNTLHSEILRTGLWKTAK